MRKQSKTEGSKPIYQTNPVKKAIFDASKGLKSLRMTKKHGKTPFELARELGEQLELAGFGSFSMKLRDTMRINVNLTEDFT